MFGFVLLVQVQRIMESMLELTEHGHPLEIVCNGVKAKTHGDGKVNNVPKKYIVENRI